MERCTVTDQAPSESGVSGLSAPAITCIKRLLDVYDQELARAQSEGANDEVVLLRRRQRILGRILTDAAVITV